MRATAVIFSSPQRKGMLNLLCKELGQLDLRIIDDTETFGIDKFWLRWEKARQICLASKNDNYLVLPDDIKDIDLVAIEKIFEQYENKPFVCSIINDGRAKKANFVSSIANYKILDWNYFDCGGLSNRVTFERFNVERSEVKNDRSGVGDQLTLKFRRLNVPMLITFPSLCYHGDHASVMHPLERLKNPLISINFKNKTMSNQKYRVKPQYEGLVIIWNGTRIINANLTDTVAEQILEHPHRRDLIEKNPGYVEVENKKKEAENGSWETAILPASQLNATESDGKSLKTNRKSKKSTSSSI